MNKPRKGFAREIYDILEEHGPCNYHMIRRHLKSRGAEMRPKQAKTALNNLMGRKFVQRYKMDPRRYEILVKQPDVNKNSMISPVTGKPISALTRQLIRHAPPIPNESLADNIQAAIHKETRNQSMIFMEYVFIVGISAGVAAITTILMRYL